MIKILLKDGTEIIGTIDKETEEYYLVDEIVAFGDIVYIEKKDIDKMERVAR